MRARPFVSPAWRRVLVALVVLGLPAAVICGWAYRDKFTEIGRYCSRMSWREMSRFLRDEEATALVGPHTATLFYAGDSEALLDPEEGGAGLVRDLEASVAWLQEHLMTPEQRRPIPQRTIAFGDWVDSQGQRIERLYDTEARERGNRVVDIGAVYHDPRDLACFPERDKPPPEHTMQGWVDFQVARSAG